DEVIGAAHEVQALQLLTESRIIRGNVALTNLRHQIASKYGYVNNEHAIDLTRLREGLFNLKAAYAKGFIGRLARSKQSLLNRKILKLFCLREFFYLATLFSVAEVAIAVVTKGADFDEIIRILSAPCLIKVASFASPSGFLVQLIHSQSPETVAEA